MPAAINAQNWIDQIEQRKAQLNDPALKAMCDTLIRHVTTELVGDLDATYATMVPDPVYHNWGGFTNRQGPVEYHIEDVKEIYGAPVRAYGGYPPVEIDMDRFMVSPECIALDGMAKMMMHGGDLVSLGEDADSDAWYAVETRIAIFFPFRDGLMVGEDAYIDHLAKLTKLGAEEAAESWYKG